MTLDDLNTLVTRTETIEAWIADQIAVTGPGETSGSCWPCVAALDVGILQLGEATSILHTLLSAGGESTTSLLGNAVRMLAEIPDDSDVCAKTRKIPTCSWKRPCASSRRSGKPCVASRTTPRWAASTSPRVPRSCCSSRPRTEIPRSSTAPTKSIWTRFP